MVTYKTAVECCHVAKDWVPSGVSSVTLKWAGTPGRAGTVLTMAGTLPEARAPPDKAWQPMWTLC